MPTSSASCVIHLVQYSFSLQAIIKSLQSTVLRAWWKELENEHSSCFQGSNGLEEEVDIKRNNYTLCDTASQMRGLTGA